jgi:hypothetical protein
MKKLLLCSLAGCGMMLLAAGTANAKGSLAVNKANPKQYGWAVNMHSFGESDDSALSHCGRGCEVVYHFNGSCAAFASQDRPNGATGWSHAPTREEAERGAVQECEKYSSTGCEVRVWGCDTD